MLKLVSERDEQATVTIRLDEKRRAVVSLGKAGDMPGKVITLYGAQIESLFSPKIANFILEYSRKKFVRRDPSERDSELAMRRSESTKEGKR